MHYTTAILDSDWLVVMNNGWWWWWNMADVVHHGYMPAMVDKVWGFIVNNHQEPKLATVAPTIDTYLVLLTSEFLPIRWTAHRCHGINSTKSRLCFWLDDLNLEMVPWWRAKMTGLFFFWKNIYVGNAAVLTTKLLGVPKGRFSWNYGLWKERITLRWQSSVWTVSEMLWFSYICNMDR